MATKKSIKYRTDNIFERMTGLKIYHIIGGSGCQITPHPRILYKGKQYMTRAVAASLYYNMNITDLGRVSSTCGISNCVHLDHLILQGKKVEKNPVTKFKNLSKTGRSKTKQNAPDQDGNIHGIHHSIWDNFNDYQRSLARTGKYTQVQIGYMKEPVTPN